MKKFLGILILAGCTKTTYVPAQCPKPPAVAPVTYRTDMLTPTSTAKDTIEAYVLDLTECRGNAEQLKLLLDTYR